jgi:hypothetical protein
MEDVMSPREVDFLSGFEKAALLTQQVRTCPPSYTSAREYIRDVAQVLRGSDGLVERGLVIGCLSAVGEV